MKVLIVHFGSWFGEEKPLGYQYQIDTLTKELEKYGISAERALELPIKEKVDQFDAVAFISLSFKKEAREMRRIYGGHVFVITGLVEPEDNLYEVITIDKKIGWIEIARTMSDKLLKKSALMIRTWEHSVANRNEMEWRPVPENMRDRINAFLDEKPRRRATIENGGIVAFNTCQGMLTQELKKA